MPHPDTGLATCCWQWGAALCKGYGMFGYKGGVIQAHRVALLMAGRELPVGNKGLTIDHICRNRACVRVEHLRVATKSEQMINIGLIKSNKSGVRGVFWDKRRGKWKVQVKLHGKGYYGGRFSNLNEAAAAASELRDRLFGNASPVA